MVGVVLVVGFEDVGFIYVFDWVIVVVYIVIDGGIVDCDFGFVVGG